MPTERQVQVADYGVDAPGIVRNMLITGLVSIAVGYFLPTLKIGDAELFLGDIVMTSGIFIAAAGLAMLLYAHVGKFRHRDRILAMLNWRGDETVVDIGTGRGLL